MRENETRIYQLSGLWKPRTIYHFLKVAEQSEHAIATCIQWFIGWDFWEIDKGINRRLISFWSLLLRSQEYNFFKLAEQSKQVMQLVFNVYNIPELTQFRCSWGDDGFTQRVLQKYERLGMWWWWWRYRNVSTLLAPLLCDPAQPSYDQCWRRFMFRNSRK